MIISNLSPVKKLVATKNSGSLNSATARKRRRRTGASSRLFISAQPSSPSSPCFRFFICSVLLLICCHGPACVQSKYYDVDSSTSDEAFLVGGRHHSIHYSYSPSSSSHPHPPYKYIPSGNWTEVGVSPPVLNLATKAHIEVNATCGERSPETYCKLVEHTHNSRRNSVRTSQCQVCDAHSSDKGKRHPIRYTIDGSNRWWQSPTLQNGRNYEWVTITIDLKQIYQVAYIIIKSAISPRPGNWILERSIDGYVYLPWQYYAVTDDECWSRYRIRAKPGKPSYSSDEEVICTSYYSQITPFEGGEIHTSLVNGRPGADGLSEQLTRFTMARYVRLRLQKIRTLHGDLMTGNIGGGGPLDKSVLRRYFYSIKDISIGGHCVCFGHANECVVDQETGNEKCMCQHNTCGDRCDICCPLYNQYSWGAGNSTDSASCQQCQCYGHADSCIYDQQIHQEGRSINIHDQYDGGGVCLDCKHHTTGVNCDLCVEGYYRPKGVPLNDPSPCLPCSCHLEGSTGKCIRDEEDALKYGGGLQPGDCICREGFEGRNCDRCQMGYKNFPRCSPCPCNIFGITNMDCDGDCQCKANVEGRLCSFCKPGYFDLKKENEDGCTQCFCHGVSSACGSSNFSIVQMSDGENWFVTDLHGTKTISSAQITPQDNDIEDDQQVVVMKNKTYQIANEEFAQFSDYYWTTMPMNVSSGTVSRFSGNKIHSYGLNVTFRVSWVKARGDTSGRPIPNYDLIIQGTTTSMLGFSYSSHDGNNATISAVLTEGNCMVLPDVDNHIVKIQERITMGASYGSRRQGVPCTRYDVMEVLSNIKRILFRAKYHTDQIEGLMHWAYMESALVSIQDGGYIIDLDGDDLVIVSGSRATSVEVCTCPTGYTGTSCEQCSYGYRKLRKDSWLTECIQCDCNGHSESCDFEGNCLKCDHNTKGAHCENCEEGYYGDPTVSKSKTACRKCECPLGLPTNNFSPTCRSKGNSYECTDCPIGYEGEYCERCSNGYYGNPSHPGDFCKPCQCSNSNPMSGAHQNVSKVDICDHLTGECLVCPRNTVGWNCDECAPGHYGNPLNGSCVICSCSEVGSTSVTTCHHDTGQCACKQNFVGRSCDKCLENHGNPQEGCPSCGCNPLGSLDSICDVITGQCPCLPGVAGRYCNKCEDSHFGFSGGRGCTACECSPFGCERQDLCDLQTGQCHCLPHVTGRKCNTCEPGWWNIKSGKGCERCFCDLDGSFGATCDAITGQCICKPGVGGLQCSQCLEGHWGKNYTGCKQCDPCDKPGHICNPLTGRCVCPPNTEGDNCEKCTVGFWGYSPVHGCQPCNCSTHGSVQPQCHPTTGKCVCQWGFEGDKCNQCRFGYFGYPTCQPCQCDSAGTLESQCSGENGTCTCNIATGQCTCRENVTGAKCERCKPGYYGLDEENPDGCMQCFCFHRTNKCSQGYFKWQRFAMPVSQDRSLGPLIRTDSQLRRLNDLMVIPDSARDVIIEKDVSFSMPLYWQLPHIFLGDKVLSYNGHLRFHTHSIGGVPPFPHHVLATYPIIQIQGNHRLILEHYSANPSYPYTRGYYDVRLHEDDWRLKNGPYNGQVSKEVMMVALQNLQHILVRATYSPEVYNASIFNVSLDIAIPSPSNDKTMAHGIEVCDCPPEYNSTSCQNPRIGWYRWYKRDYITSTVIIDLVGEARRCDCNGRANSCDTETGRCQNCLEHTSGPRCEQCEEGYYGNPLRGRCLPCPCPSIWNNHAKACHQRNAYPQWSPSHPQHHVTIPSTIKWHCTCLQGYTGPQCDRCDYGYYGRPWERGGHCTPCRCNLYGSVSDECDEITGQCNCRPGVTGRDCSKCKERHVIIGKECTSCDDQCTGTLLNDLLDIHGKLSKLKVDPESVLVFKKMVNLDEGSKKALVQWNNQKAVGLFLDDLPGYQNLAGILESRMSEMKQRCEKSLGNSYLLVERGKVTMDLLEAVQREILANVKFLQDYAAGRLQTGEGREMALRELGDVISQMEHVSMDMQEITHAAEDELTDINSLFDELIVKLFNTTGKAGTLVEGMKAARVKLDQFRELIEKCRGKVNEAGRVIILAKEHLDNYRANTDLIDNVTLDVSRDAAETQIMLNEGGYLKTELDQVLLMIEDMLREFRNTTKELEIRDNLLFDKVPLFRVLYAQPAFDHELEMIMQQKYIEGIFGPLVGHGNGTQSTIQAVTAFERMRTGFIDALAKAKNATEIGRITELEIQNILDQYSQAGLLETSSTLVDSVLALSVQLENGPLRRNLTDCKSNLDKLEWNTKVANESLRHVNTKLDGYLETSMQTPELIERISEISDIIKETSQMVVETDSKVHNELKARIDAIRGGAPFDSVDAAIQVNRVSHQIPQVEHDLIQGERRLQEISGKNRESLQDRLKYLKALIQQSRHKANTVGVSIGPDDTGTCFRVYTLPQLMDSSATSLRFNFAPTRTQDSLLLYWPSSLNEDFVSIEMVNLHVRVSWDLGSGLRTLTHQTKLHPLSLQSDDPDHWWEISFERIGSFVSLDVNPVSIDETLPPPQRNAPIKYINLDEEATLLNLAPSDYLHIGGMPRETRPGLVDNGMLSGCIHNLHVNHKPVGLWNFARTEGCQPCVECPAASMDTMVGSTGELEYYFDGRGYAVMERIRSQTFNSKFFDVSLEFKTFSENGLLFLTVNQTIGQIISVELKEGRILMHVRHRWGAHEEKDILRVETEPPEVKYNTGDWTTVRALWVYQKGTQTAKLIVGNRDFMQEKRSNSGQQLSLKLYQANYQVGGVSPTFDPTKWDHVLPVIVPYVGCMKNVLVDGNTYDPMAGHYFGVESPCGGKTVYLTSFEGNGYAEFGSTPIGKNFKMGFTFKTVQPKGLMLLSTFAKGLESPDEHYYAVYLEQGKVHVQIGVPQGPFDLFSNGTHYDDGRYHSVRFFKKSRRLYLYVDDEELMEWRIPKQAVSTTVNAPQGRGLFVGGTTTQIQRKFEETPLQVRDGFRGCIKNLYFGNNLLNFNYPVSYENQNLGQCPKHHEPDPLLVKYLYANMGIDSSAVVRMTDSECSGGGATNEDGGPVVIDQEEPFKAWHFGDSPNSYATLSLLGSKVLKQSFNISFHFRTFYPNGMFFQGLRKRSNGGYCLMSFLKDGQVIVKLHGNRPQDLVSSVSSLNDGRWHHIVIIKAEDKMYLHIDGRNATQTQVPKIKAIGKMHIGGVPSDGHDCLENSIHKPEYFKGCLKNFIINSHFYNLDSNSAQLSNVSPCFSRVEPGTFFRSGSYAIYSHNFTLGTMLEVELDFKSDSRNGLLLSLVPNKLASKYPRFSIFLRDGKVIAREAISGDDYYEASANFHPDKGYICNGHWHNIRANYEKGSITLRVDGKLPIFALAEPESPHSRISTTVSGTVGNSERGLMDIGSNGGSLKVGTIYIGGMDDGASRSNSKLQFHGCIRNIVLNRQIRDWTDMALIHNVYLNSCPL